MKHTTQSQGFKLRFSHLAKTGAAIALSTSLSGCLLTSPFWNQVFASHTDQVPLQAYTTNKTLKVKFECAKAYHGGLYPDSASVTWTQVGNVMPGGRAMYDSFGLAAYTASKKMVLPASCWRQDTGNGKWYSSIRATQTNGANVTQYNVFDQAGLACLGEKTGAQRRWLAGIGCQLKSGGSNFTYVIFRADS